MTSLHTFVISWPGFHDKAATIEKGVGRDVSVLNSDAGAHEPHWVLQPREAFYSARWNKALELCRSDVMGIVCADVTSTAWSRVMFNSPSGERDQSVLCNSERQSQLYEARYFRVERRSDRASG